MDSFLSEREAALVLGIKATSLSSMASRGDIKAEPTTPRTYAEQTLRDYIETRSRRSRKPDHNNRNPRRKHLEFRSRHDKASNENTTEIWDTETEARLATMHSDPTRIFITSPFFSHGKVLTALDGDTLIIRFLDLPAPTAKSPD